MAGPRLPFELVEARGAKHLTKAEAAQRRDAESRNPEPGKRLTPPAWLPESQRKEFSRVSQGLILLMPSMISRLDGDTIATYCLARQQWLAASQRAGRALAEGKLEEAQGWSLIQDRCFKAARACATDLGLTISSRCRLVVPEGAKKTEPNAFEELLRSRRREA